MTIVTESLILWILCKRLALSEMWTIVGFVLMFMFHFGLITLGWRYVTTKKQPVV